jgi:hypothetical protein
MSQMFLEHAKDTVDMKVLQEQVNPLCADPSLEPSVRLQALHLMQVATLCVKQTISSPTHSLSPSLSRNKVKGR